MKNQFQWRRRGSSIVLVVFIIFIGMLASLGFLVRSGIFLSVTGMSVDKKSADFQVEEAEEIAQSKIRRLISTIGLSGKLPLVAGGPSSESFSDLSNAYFEDFAADPSAGATLFLRHVVQTMGMGPSGATIPGSEFATFEQAFPTAWTDTNLSDDKFYEVRYDFSPLPPSLITVGQAEMRFEYEYRVQVRAYGKTYSSKSSAENSGVISLSLRGSPFSRYALFRSQNRNQNGWLLVFAGGNSTGEVQEFFDGPVHVNAAPHFYGHPNFFKTFSSATATTDWWQGSSSSYSPAANFAGGSSGGVASIEMPIQLFNTLRLAAGDQTNGAATNLAPPANSELLSYLRHHANGDIPAAATSVPTGVYIPLNNQSLKTATGGIYVEGNAAITMNVVSGSSDLATYWSNINAAHRGCKFQKLRIDHSTAGIPTRDIFIGDDPCFVTYVFNGDNPSSSPTLVNGRLNGNVYVNGEITALGGESRTRAAVVKDFGFNITATKDVKINNDLQYEDAEYVAVNSSMVPGTTVVATPTGPTGSSGFAPTSAGVAPKIASDSHTILGVVSLYRNVLIRADAPSNLNIHAAIYAGNSADEDSVTGLGCGSDLPNKNGCGFGFEGWDSVSGRQSLKILGSIAEYRSQTLGRLTATPTGYARRLLYDSRFLTDLTPPGFPLSNSIQIYATRRPYNTWRIVSNE